MHFEIIGQVSGIQTIAFKRNIRILRLLEKRFGRGRWRELKGIANVRLSDGTIRLSELHCFEAHGIGKKKLKV